MGFFTEEQYVRKMSDCQNCPSNNNKLWGEGSYRGGIIFLGLSPNNKEDQHKKLYVGETGRVFNKALKKVNIRLSQEWITNISTCKIDTNSKTIIHCNSGFEEELDFLWKKGYRVIVVMGRKASNVLLNTEEPIDNIRGKIYNKYKYIVVPTYHPSEIVRRGGFESDKWADWVQDIQTASDELLLEVV